MEFQPPLTHIERERLEPVHLQTILAVEDHPPPGVEPVCWLLLTTLSVSCFEDFLARKGDGEPGVKTIWQGLRRLHDIAQTWLLLSPTSSTCVKEEFVKKDVTNA